MGDGVRHWSAAVIAALVLLMSSPVIAGLIWEMVR